jgi:hypothetical protein
MISSRAIQLHKILGGGCGCRNVVGEDVEARSSRSVAASKEAGGGVCDRRSVVRSAFLSFLLLNRRPSSKLEVLFIMADGAGLLGRCSSGRNGRESKPLVELGARPRALRLSKWNGGPKDSVPCQFVGKQNRDGDGVSTPSRHCSGSRAITVGFEFQAQFGLHQHLPSAVG